MTNLGPQLKQEAQKIESRFKNTLLHSVWLVAFAGLGAAVGVVLCLFSHH